MSYEFQSTLFRTEREMLNAVASEWLSAGGMNDRETMREFLADMTNEQLADECIQTWDLDQPEGDKTSWLENRGVNRADIQSAFAHLRASFDEMFPIEAA